MKVKSDIFKSYDIRGIYKKEFDNKAVEAIGKTFCQIIKPKKVIVGHDGRISGPILKKIIIKALLSQGVDVIDIGEVSTDMYYFACAEKGLPGIMITASHNPKEYNGFKMVRKIPYFLTGDKEIAQMRDLILAGKIPAEKKKRGKVEKWDVMDEFIEKILSLADYKKFRKMKIVADPGNGMVGPILKKLEKYLKQIKFVKMYWAVDGTFPNHGGDPLLVENRKQLQKRVVKEKADLGIAFDTDGDRFFSIDSKGRFVHGDFFTAILANYFLKNKKGPVVYDIRASWVVPDTIKRLGGKPLYNKVGHSYIKARMKKEKAFFGGEVSGHYYFPKFYLCDTGIGAFMYLLAALSENGKTLTDYMSDYSSKYFISGEINNQVKDVRKILKKIERKYADKAKKIVKIDGVTCFFDNWKFNVRGSNTQPLIRLNLEAKSEKKMKAKTKEVLSIIKNN